MATAKSLPYLKDEKPFGDYAYQALASRFDTREEFDQFYQAIASDHQKNEFLRVASLYLFLVKHGDWTVNVAGSNPVVDYLTNSYKLVSLLSLIESLGDGKHIDLYHWLTARKRTANFPLTRDSLNGLYKDYKQEFGAIQRCIAFFETLPKPQQKKLVGAFSLGDDKMTLKDVAAYLYELRSKFVHEGKLVLQISTGPHVVLHKKKAKVLHLSMPDVLEIFEHGVVAHFRLPAPAG